MTRSRRLALIVVALPFLLGGTAWTWNQVAVDRWVEDAQDADPRNASFHIDGRYRYYVVPNTLVLDLTQVTGEMSPAGLFRGLFQIAERAAEDGHRYDRIVLARSREPVFVMKGEDFYTLGEERSLGQNPVYQVRTLPEKLYRPDGEGAFGQWTGGVLGVLKEQMEDVNEAARAWVQGETPTS